MIILIRKRHNFFKYLPLPHLLYSTNNDKFVQRSKFTAALKMKYFEFHHFENELYNWWEKSGYFRPDSDMTKKSFVIPMPPPNVTGYLHMGHALFLSIQDTLSRFHRMRGKSTLWLPGTDHAGIATQMLVQQLVEKEGTTRNALGREEFLKRIWKWKVEKGSYISQQMRRLGASADWSREKFTLQEDMNTSVTEAFVRLYEKDLIYKGSYLVNWSPSLHTAISDLEVEYSEENGYLYYFKYKLELIINEDKSMNDDYLVYLLVSTTRPETILGDTAVCVHPDDPRYRSLIGRRVQVPFTDRTVPVIADSYVDRDFGTGVVKITPAHDHNDYEIGKRHNLPMLNILNEDGTMHAVCGPRYSKLDRLECRALLWGDLESAGLAVKKDPHVLRVPRSQRGGDVVEPLLSEQWFVRTGDMANRAAAALRTGHLTILPQNFEKIWYGWLENNHDWCVSRQMWWGHRVPAYYVTGGTAKAGDFVVARNEESAARLAIERFGHTATVRQDEDVLDTWFSSALWPFSTLGWPHEDPTASSDLNRFYPAQCLETGYDILFFWVARMVMLGLELTGKVPFETVYLHGLVRDENGQKMSKTKGNVVDPLDAMNEYGCDALRHTLLSNSSAGQDVAFSSDKIEGSRNFVNKIWNIGKYVSVSLEGVDHDLGSPGGGVSEVDMPESVFQSLPLAERWVVSACHAVVNQSTAAIESYNHSEAIRLISNFVWFEFADWYVEVSKIKLRPSPEGHCADPRAVSDQQQTARVLRYVWQCCLKLLHPFTPFVTEVLWQMMSQERSDSANGSDSNSNNESAKDSIMMTRWPLMENTKPENSSTATAELMYRDLKAEKAFQTIQKIVTSVRNARAQYGAPPTTRLQAVVCFTLSASQDEEENDQKNDTLKLFDSIYSERAIICSLAKLDENKLQFITIKSSDNFTLPESMGKSINIVVEDKIQIYIPLADMVDEDKEFARLNKQLVLLKATIGELEVRVANQKFIEKAPKKIVTEVFQQIDEKRTELSLVEKALKDRVSSPATGAEAVLMPVVGQGIGQATQVGQCPVHPIALFQPAGGDSGRQKLVCKRAIRRWDPVAEAVGQWAGRR